MRIRSGATALLGLLVVLASVVPSGAGHDPVTCGSGQDGAAVRHIGRNSLWPPNHKYHPATVRAAETGTHSVELSTWVSSSQPEDMIGSGHTSNDVTPATSVATPRVTSGAGSTEQTYRVRSERSGTVMEGRTYTIHYEAWFDHNGTGTREDGETCSGTFDIHVPHDCRLKGC